MTPTEKLEDLLRIIAGAISRKDKAVIEHVPGDFLFRLQVSPSDQGRFVGKLGQTIWAIQTIFWYAGFTQVTHNYTIHLLEPKIPHDRHCPIPFRFNPEWDRAKISSLATAIHDYCLPVHSRWKLTEINKTTALIHLVIEAYLQTPIHDPSFVDAYTIVMKVAGMSQGVNIKTDVTFA